MDGRNQEKEAGTKSRTFHGPLLPAYAKHTTHTEASRGMHSEFFAKVLSIYLGIILFLVLTQGPHNHKRRDGIIYVGISHT